MSSPGFSVQVDLETGTVLADRCLDRVDGCFIAWVGHLAGDPPDMAAKLVGGYRQDCAAFSARLLGQYAGILIDPAGRRVLLFQDSLGLRTVYYAVDGTRLSVAADLGALARLRGSIAVEPAYFAALIADGLPPHHISPLQGARRLSIGTTIEFKGARRTALQPWSPMAETVPQYPDAGDQLRALLDEAVSACLPQSGAVGCELSGGLDSTSVYAMLLRRRPDAHAITLVSGAGLAGDDEAFAAHVIETLGGTWHCLDIDRCPPFAGNSVRFAGEPGDDRLATRQTAYRAIIETNKIDVVLTGAGGDLMFGYRGIAPIHLADAIYGRHLLDAVGKTRIWSARQGGTRPWTHYFAHYGLQPAWRHLRRRSLFTDRDWRPPAWLSAGFVKNHGLDQAPKQAIPRLRKPSSQFLWEGAYRIATLETSSGFRQHLPCQTRLPLFHRPLVAFMFGLDWTLRDSGVRGEFPGDRALQRAALAQLLPARVAFRRTKASDQKARERSALQQSGFFDGLKRTSRLVCRGWVEPAAWAAAVDRARFGVYDKFSSFDAAIATELWLRVFEAHVLEAPPILYKMAGHDH